MEVAEGHHDAQFPVDVFQTGSGTSSNMNANEVIARLATEQLGEPVHPNDDVNMGQSSNDVIPTAVHVSAALLVNEELLPGLAHLQKTLKAKARELSDVVKTGRTHLMDAMPVRLDQEIGGWATQVGNGAALDDPTRLSPRFREALESARPTRQHTPGPESAAKLARPMPMAAAIRRPAMAEKVERRASRNRERG